MVVQFYDVQIICVHAVNSTKADTSQKADLRRATLSHAICLQHELFGVNQTYNLLVIVMYDTRNVMGF